MSQKCVKVLLLVLKCAGYVAAVLCESYIAFIICLHNGFGAAVYGLLLAAIWVGNLLAFGIQALKAGSRAEKFLLIAMPVVLVLLLIIPARRCVSILGGSVGYSEYGLVRHMPFVETYMHENGMLDGYYENVIDGSLSTPDEVAWAQERLAV